MGNTHLASEVGGSPAASLRRVQRLQSKGLLEGCSVRPNAAALGGPQTVYTDTTLERQNEAALAAFEQAVAVLPEVQACHVVAADDDDRLRREGCDSDDFERLRRRSIADLPHLQRMRSVFGLRCVKRQIGPLVRL
jgi:Lrp/AsnC family leucine-responsive transcriptional regulator